MSRLKIYFNPRAPRGARRGSRRAFSISRHISIHAPREGRDHHEGIGAERESNFNPRAPRGARRRPSKTSPSRWIFQSTRPARGATIHRHRTGCTILFQSTRPARGATLSSRSTSARSRNFNPRAPRGARQDSFRLLLARVCISIHAPREGRDGIRRGHTEMRLEFQSTRPARGATSPAFLAMQKPRISIHAPREGRDKVMPRPTTESEISIHAPREGRDRGRATAAPDLRYFNPRAPRGARRAPQSWCYVEAIFQSTRPARGATYLSGSQMSLKLFQSTRPARGATGAK